MKPKKKKICTKCKLEKPIEEFGNLKASPDKKMPFCKTCNKSRNTSYRMGVLSVTDWSKVPVIKYESRIGNEISLGDYFKNADQKDPFIIEIMIWDNKNGEKTTLNTHTINIDPVILRKLLSFTKTDEMKIELETITDDGWKIFCDKYSKIFKEEHPNQTVGLRFKKHGSSGKQVNIGFGQKNIPELNSLFMANTVYNKV